MHSNKARCTAVASVCLLLSAASVFGFCSKLVAGANDEAALLAFKAAAAGGRSDALVSWNSSTTGGYCS